MSTLAFTTADFDSGPDVAFGRNTNASRLLYRHTSNTNLDSHNVSSIKDNVTGEYYVFFSYPMADNKYNEYTSPCHDNTRAGGAQVAYQAYAPWDGRNSVSSIFIVGSYFGGGVTIAKIDGYWIATTILGDHF